MVNKQAYNNSITQNIEMVRGDTLAFNFQLQGLEGEEPDTIVFGCAENYGDDAIFTSDLTNGITREEYDSFSDTATYSVRVAPEKTAGLEIARYFYDLQVEVNGDIFTLMRGSLTLLDEVTRG